MGNKINTLAAVFIIILISVVFGFILSQEGEALKDTTEHGLQGIDKLDDLREKLKETE